MNWWKTGLIAATVAAITLATLGAGRAGNWWHGGAYSWRGERTGSMASHGQLCSIDAKQRKIRELTPYFERDLQLNEQQKTEWTTLANKFDQSLVSLRQEVCQQDTDRTVPQRLRTAARQLDAMNTAFKSLAPDIERFYQSLDTKQRARLDRHMEQRWKH